MESKSEIFQRPSMQLMLIAVLCVFSALIFSTLAGVLTVALYGINLGESYDYTSPQVVSGLKFFQLMSAIGLFIIPPIIYGIFVSKKPIQTLSLQQFSAPKYWFLVLIMMVVATPFMSWLVEFNQQLALPDFLLPLEQWMKQSEQGAEQLTKAFLSFDGLISFLYVFLIVAIIPAFGEEMLFRGVLQKIMLKWTNNYHVAIWVTAILFSALHMQFYGFLPRMALGALFGYLFYWSNSLWLPIFGHLINNGSVVLLTFLFPEIMKNSEIQLFEGSLNVVATIISGFLFIVLIWLFKKMIHQNQ